MRSATSTPSSSRGASPGRRRIRFRNRDLFAPVLVIGVVTLAHAMAGAANALPVMAASFALVLAGICSILIGGPRHATNGMAIAAVALIGYAAIRATGPLDRAFGDLVILMAAGAVWIAGFVVSRQGRTLDLAWTILVWTSLAYCVIVFFGELAEGLPQFAAYSEGSSPTSTLTFGLLALLGCCRVLHTLKRLDAEAAPESEVAGQIMQQGLGGLLLIGFALACLGAMGSTASILITLGVLVGYCVWDLHNIIRRSYGVAVRILGWIAPQIGLFLIAWGLVTVYFDTPGAPDGLAGAGANLLLRLDTYFQAFLAQPVFGHGLGSAETVGAAMTTLHNANAMLVDGGPRNFALTWLVETGVVGFGLLLAVLAAMHVQIARGLKSKRTPRTFPRLAIAASALMFIHGVAHTSLDSANIVWFYALLLGVACGVATAGRERAGETPAIG